tara:strand:- start:662 stop:871 length:210 start_codon:yes stop_codon:yes gene_type:complete
MLERELYRHFKFVENTKNILYSNPIHIKGLFSYRDKKKLYDLNNKVEKKRETLSRRDFQFLESIVEKYG